MNPLCSEYNVFAEDQRAAEFGREQQPSRSSQSSAGRAQQNSGRNASSAGRAQRPARRRNMNTGLHGFKMMGMTLTAVAVVSKQHSFSLSDHTCADCAYIAPVYVWFSDNMLPAIYYSDAADPNSWYINAALLAINVDTTRVTDVDLEIIPGEGWENRAAPSVNKGSLGNGGTVNLPDSFSIRPTDPAAITTGTKYSYTVIVTYNGEEVVHDEWSFVLEKIENNTNVTMTKEN